MKNASFAARFPAFARVSRRHRSAHRLSGFVLLCLMLACWPAPRTAAQVAKTQTTAVTEATISTVAGGGFGSNVPVRQAPVVLPTAVALDPQGRGFYVIDEFDGTSLLRFVNTTNAPVTLAGVTILPNQINLIAGGGTEIDDDLAPRDADLAEVTGIAVDATGNAVYLAIKAFSAIRVVNVGTARITAFGRNLEPATVATVATLNFGDFRALAFHPTTRELHFIAGRVVYKFDATGTPVLVAGGGTPATGNGDGGPANRARLIAPMGLAFDNNGNLLIADGGDPRDVEGSVRRVNLAGVINSLAINLKYPTGITTAPNGDIYVALGNSQQIARITTVGSTISTTIVVGNNTQTVCNISTNPTCGDGGPALQAGLSIPDSISNKTLGLAADGRGVFIPDFRFKRVRYANLTTSAVTIAGTQVSAQAINTIVGNGLPAPYDGVLATSAELFVPTGVVNDALGNLFISDTGNNRLRFVNRTSAPITLFVTTPFATTVQPGQIVTLNSDAGDPQTDDRITTALFLSPQGLAATPNGILIVDSQAGALIKIPPTSVSGRRSGVIRFLNTSNSDVTFFAQGGDAKVVVPPGQIKDLAGVRPPANPQVLGDGLTANRVAFFPTDVAVDRSGNLYVADQGNNRVRRIDSATGVVSTVYGDGTLATLGAATGIAFDGQERLHIADTRNSRILRQNAAGSSIFTTVADAAQLINRPRDLTVDAAGKIFVTNALTHQVLEVSAPSNAVGTVTVVAGNGRPGFSGDDGPAPAARLNLPNPGTTTNDIQVTTNIITLPNGDLVFTDTNNNRVRLLRRKSSTAAVASVSAASYVGAELATESIAAAFGERLATGVFTATTTPLPTTLGGTTVTIRDSAGGERLAPLFFVAPAQINFQVPAGTIAGPATIFIASGDGTISTGTLSIATVAPGIFTANANGLGVPAAQLLRVRANGEQSYEAVSQFNAATGRYEPLAIDLGPSTDRLFLILYGTGFRYRSSLAAVSATIGGAASEVLYAGPAGNFIGLDQINLALPRTLAGRGTVDLTLIADGKAANTVPIQIK